MKKSILLFVLLGFVCALVADCKKPGAEHSGATPVNNQIVRFSSAASDMFLDETVWLDITIEDKDGHVTHYDDNPAAISLECFPEGIVELDVNRCSVKALSYGKAVVVATSRASGASASHTVYVMNPDALMRNVDGSMVVAGKQALSLNTTIQGFDLSADKKYAYWSQIGYGSNTYILNVCRRELSTGATSPGPQILYAGHGQGLAIEEEGTDVYCYLGSYGTLGSSGYENAQTIARFQYIKGVSFLPEECESHFWIPERRNLQISLDIPNDIAMIYSVGTSSSQAWYYGYRLREMKALEPCERTLSFARTYGGAGPVASKVTEKTVAMLKDLSALEPVFCFEARPPLMAAQGYSYSNGKIYLVTGIPAENQDGTYKNNCLMYIMDTRGNLLKSYDLTENLYDSLVRSLLSTDIGFFEPEGIQVSDGCIYLGFGSRVTEGTAVVRKPVVLKYDLVH